MSRRVAGHGVSEALAATDHRQLDKPANAVRYV